MGSCCDTEEPAPDRLRLEVASTTVAFAATLRGWPLPSAGLGALAIPALLLAYAAAGWRATLRAAAALRQGELDVDTLMLLAAGGAAVVGHWLEGAVLLFLFSLGNTLESFAFRRTRRSIEALVELRPEDAVVVHGGAERVVLAEALTPGDVVRVRPGDRIPVDGVVVAGSSSVDESTLTGESVPIVKKVDGGVFAGTLNGSGSLDIRMTRRSDDTALARIVRMVEQAREARAPTQSWIEDVEGRYAAGVIVAAGLAIVVPWLTLGWSFDDAFYRAMTLLVVASPCALVISIPATIVSAVSNGARHGILFKGGVHLDVLGTVTTFALDKTGTVTVGHPEVVAVHVVPGGPLADPNDLLRLAASAEARSEHHLAAAIIRTAEARDLRIEEPVGFDSVAGQGVEADVGGSGVRVGRRSWIEERLDAPIPHELLAALEAEHPTATQVHVAIDGCYRGVFAIQDQQRPTASAAVAELREAGVERVVMLTGDARRTADAVATGVGIQEVHAALRPDEKSRILTELRSAGPTAMVGDGVNDAPALATADVGIAIGVAGTDVALETADVVIMGDDLRALAQAVRLSRRTRRIVKQNLVFAVSVMGVLVIGHEGSTIVVVFNGLRLLADGR